MVLVLKQGLWGKNLRAGVPDLLLVNSVIVRNFHNLSEPQLAHVSNGNNFSLLT